MRRQTTFFIACLLALAILALVSVFTLPKSGTETIAQTEAIVATNPQRVNGLQEFIVRLPARNVRYLVKTRTYPTYRYGDILTFAGAATTPGGQYGGYLKTKRVAGISYYPTLVKTGTAPQTLRGVLYRVRNAFGETLARVLPGDEAALINGITLGGYNDFSASLLQAMRKSSTMHLVALSGYNVAIVFSVIVGVCVAFMKRRTALITALIILAAFVVMTGAESSVVRAALMGGVAACGSLAGRARDDKNIIALTALAMVVVNPHILLFDTGFQLSFLALVGIVYLKPRLQKLLKVTTKGFLSWKENVLTTASAQLAVLPVIVLQFSTFPVLALFANTAILSFIPVTMLLGFVTATVGFVSTSYALIPGFVLHMLLSYVIAIIHLFG